MVPIVLSVLGALLYQSGKYHFVDVQREIAQLDDESQALADKVHQQTAERKTFGEMFDGSLEKIEKRTAFFDIVNHRGIYRASSTTDETHSRALDSLTQINDQLGQISGLLRLAFRIPRCPNPLPYSRS
jgi:hypothetical protein